MKKVLVTLGVVVAMSLAGSSFIQAESAPVVKTEESDCAYAAQMAANEAYAAAINQGAGGVIAGIMARAAYMDTMSECLSLAGVG